MPLACPKLREDLQFFPDPLDDNYINVKDPLTSQAYRYNQMQVAMMHLLDGKRTTDDIINAIGEEYGIEISAEQVEGFIPRLERQLLLDITSYASDSEKLRKQLQKALRRRGLWWPGASQELARTAPSTHEAFLFQRGLRHIEYGDPLLATSYFTAVLEVNPANEASREILSIIHETFFLAHREDPGHLTMVHLFNPDRFLGWIDRLVGWWMYGPVGVALLVLSVLGGAWAMVNVHWPAVSSFRPIDFVLAGLLLVVFLLIHECGHGLSCKHYGGSVTDMGLALMYGVIPAAYCDVGDSHFFTQRRQKLIVLVSGVAAGILMQGGLLVLCAVTSDAFFLRRAILLMILLVAWQNVSNILPFIKLDGYYVLADGLGIDNLRERSFAYVIGLAKRHLLGIRVELETLSLRDRIIFISYGVVAGLYTIVKVYLVWAWVVLPKAIERFHLLGILFAIGYCVFVPGRKITEGLYLFIRLLREHRRDIFTVRRTLAYAAVVGGIVFGLTRPWPLFIDGKATVEPSARAFVYAETPGILSTIAVRDGDHVASGQVLARLDNPELVRDRDEERALVERARIVLAKLRAGARAEELAVARSKERLEDVERRYSVVEAARITALSDAHVRSDDDSDSARRQAVLAADDRAIAGAATAVLRALVRPEEIAAAEANVARHEARLAELESDVDRLTLRSPFAGVVVRPHLDERRGERLHRGTALCEVYDLSHVRAKIQLPLQEPLRNLSVGEPVRFRTFGAPVVEGVAKVDHIRAASEQDSIVVQTDAIANEQWPAWSTGHARIYCPPRSIAYVLFGVPLVRLFDYNAWSLWAA